MFPKQIIIKTTSKALIDMLSKELSVLPSIRYNSKKINCVYTISIKCSNYYSKFSTICSESIYGNYIYLYTNISLIISKIIIDTYENIIAKRQLYSNYFYCDNSELKTIFNIVSSILDSNYPSEVNHNYYLYRKRIILNELLKIFRHQNYIYIDSLINFSLLDYKNDILETIDKIVDLITLDNNYCELIKLIFHDLFF